MFNKVKKQLLLAMYIAYAEQNFVSKTKVLTEVAKIVNRFQPHSEMPSSETIDEILTELERDDFIVVVNCPFASEPQEPPREPVIKLCAGQSTDLAARMFEQIRVDNWRIPITDDYPSLALPNKEIARCYAKKRRRKVASIATLKV